MIIGASRAAQGLQPEVLNKYFPDHRFFNFAFTVIHSPYGPSYLKAIKKKLSPETNDGIFLISVNPFTISSKTTNPDDSIHFRELNGCIAKTTYLNFKPNFDYLLVNYNNFLKKFINRKNHDKRFLHQDGWLEITVNMDTDSVEERTQKKIKSYTGKEIPQFRFSRLRLKYLTKTIKFLKQHGKVYMIRLPMEERMFTLEEKYLPGFDSIIQSVANTCSVPYFDLTPKNKEYIYTDGNHLYKKSGSEVSRLIAEWIITIRENPAKTAPISVYK